MLTWSMSAVLKSISSWAALAAVPVAASIARPRTSCRRLRAPFSNWLTRLEMIASMTTPFFSGVNLATPHYIVHFHYVSRGWIWADTFCSNDESRGGFRSVLLFCDVVREFLSFLFRFLRSSGRSLLGQFLHLRTVLIKFDLRFSTCHSICETSFDDRQFIRRQCEWFDVVP